MDMVARKTRRATYPTKPCGPDTPTLVSTPGQTLQGDGDGDGSRHHPAARASCFWVCGRPGPEWGGRRHTRTRKAKETA